MKGYMPLSVLLRVRVVQAVLGGAGLAGVGQAHDVWITFLPGLNDSLRAVINHGHPGDRKTPDPDKLFELRVVGPDGREQQMRPEGMPQMLEGIPVLVTPLFDTKGATGTWLVAARYDNGYWVKTDYGHRNTSKLEFPNASESLHSMKFAKALLANGTSTPSMATRVIGHRLELVPLDDPFSVQMAGKLRVRVLFEGKPLTGVGVEIGDGVTPKKEEEIPRYPTNAEGIAVLPIGRAGLQVIAVDYKMVSHYSDLADKEMLAATLSFDIAEK